MSPEPLGSRGLYAPAPPGSAGDACGEGIVCAVTQAAEPVIMGLWLGAFAVVTLAALGYLSRARAACEAERGRLVAERDAFEDFVGQVTDLDPTPVRMTDGAGRDAPMAGDVGPSDDLAAVRDAYRQTVMDVPHYEAEYGESLDEHMSAELGADVATAVTSGGRLTPGLQRAVASAASEAHRRRVAVIEHIEDEEGALAAVSEDLEAVRDRLLELNEVPLSERSAPELADLHEELAGLAADCRDVLERRQDQLPERAVGGTAADVEEFSEYIYGSMDVSFPALSATVETLKTVRTAQRRVRLAFTAAV